jgi:hypothetical protein
MHSKVLGEVMQMMIYKNIGLSLAIEVDIGQRILYAYNFEDGEVLQESRSILKAIASDIVDDLQNSLEIRLSEFDVEVIDEDIMEMKIW